MMKEKKELKAELDKALADLKKRDGNSDEMDALNAELKSQIETLKKKLTDSELQLEII